MQSGLKLVQKYACIGMAPKEILKAEYPEYENIVKLSLKHILFMHA